MATKQYILRGTFKWMNHLFNLDEKYGKYSVDFYPSEESWELYNTIGLGLDIREDPEDGKYVKFSRKHSQLIKDQQIVFGAPKVYNADGTLKTEIGSMGNGTEGMVKIEVYDTQKGKGHRLAEVAIINEVEYVPDPDKAVKEVVTAGDVVPW